MNIKIELPDTYTVTSRGVEVPVAVGKLSADIIARLAMHGLQQKVADAASGAAKLEGDVAANTLTLMQGAVDGLMAGTWTQRTAGGGVSEETRVGRSIARASLKANWGAKSAKWKEFDGLSDDDQNTKLDTVLADNAKLFADAIAAKLAERKRDREQKAALGKTVAINI